MTDEGQDESPDASPPNEHPPVVNATLEEGRCDQCGNILKGLPEFGNCPECGSNYIPESAARLKPWPSAVSICLRMGWPIAGLLFAGSLLMNTGRSNDATWLPGMIIGYAMIVAVGINSYFQVRSMLRKSLPDAIRTKGPVAIWRKIGTTICVLVLLVFVGGPFIFGVGCLILLSGQMRF